jgi:hypothetical protein
MEQNRCDRRMEAAFPPVAFSFMHQLLYPISETFLFAFWSRHEQFVALVENSANGNSDDARRFGVSLKMTLRLGCCSAYVRTYTFFSERSFTFDQESLTRNCQAYVRLPD